MGQYWKVVNLDKREYVSPHNLGAGLKLWEQLANHPGTGAALIVLCAAMPEPRGGGDFDLDANWHGPERKHNSTPGPMPEAYPAIAKRTIGRWAGDRITLVGDYAVNSDLPRQFKASTIYGKCRTREDVQESIRTYEKRLAEDGLDAKGKARYRKYLREAKAMLKPGQLYRDISLDVAAVIAHELNGKFEGDGWKSWNPQHSREDLEYQAANALDDLAGAMGGDKGRVTRAEAFAVVEKNRPVRDLQR